MKKSEFKKNMQASKDAIERSKRNAANFKEEDEHNKKAMDKMEKTLIEARAATKEAQRMLQKK